MKLPDYACPKCRECGDLRVIVTVARKLVQNPQSDNYETHELDDGADEEWDERSPMECGSCDYRGEVDSFNTNRRTWGEPARTLTPEELARAQGFSGFDRDFDPKAT
jgi:hypothetical protein